MYYEYNIFLFTFCYDSLVYSSTIFLSYSPESGSPQHVVLILIRLYHCSHHACDDAFHKVMYIFIIYFNMAYKLCRDPF